MRLTLIFRKRFREIGTSWFPDITGAVAEIVDSLDDIEILEESDRLLRPEVLNAVDDHRLRAILEVSVRDEDLWWYESRKDPSHRSGWKDRIEIEISIFKLVPNSSLIKRL